MFFYCCGITFRGKQDAVALLEIVVAVYLKFIKKLLTHIGAFAVRLFTFYALASCCVQQAQSGRQASHSNGGNRLQALPASNEINFSSAAAFSILIVPLSFHTQTVTINISLSLGQSAGVMQRDATTVCFLLYHQAFFKFRKMLFYFFKFLVITRCFRH